MSNDESKKSGQNLPKPETKSEVVYKGQISEIFNYKESIKEGYQPTDTLNTSNPPSDKGNRDTK